MAKQSKAKAVKDLTKAAHSSKPDSGEEQLHPERRIAKTDEGESLFYFHNKGDYLKGFFLGSRSHDLLHYTQKTYVMQVGESRQDGIDRAFPKGGRIIEFPALFKLQSIISGRELLGSFLRIVYEGKPFRYKLFSVFQDKGTFFTDEQVLTATRKLKGGEQIKRLKKKKGVKHGRAKR